MDRARETAEILLKIEAVKVKVNPPFKWTSGILSPVYCDNRKLISFPQERQFIVRSFADLMREKGIEPEYIGGTATAAIPWAAFLAYELGLPMIYIRPEKKAHGSGKQVEGYLPEGKRVLIVEDLISTGGSSIAAAEAVKNECKGVVTDVLAIVSWELAESFERFSKSGINLHTLTNFTNIIGFALERKDFKKKEYESIMEFKNDPRKWGDKIQMKS